MKEAKAKNETYKPFRYSNGDTRKQLLARAKFILTKHKSKWTESQRLRAEIIFENYTELKQAYDLAMELTDIYNARSIKDAARLKLAKWFNKVEKLGVDNLYTVIDTFKNHYDIPYSISLSIEPQMPMLNPSMQKSKPSGHSSGE